jgi:DNA-binding winged helix-turn-helix (wHTH) protein
MGGVTSMTRSTKSKDVWIDDGGLLHRGADWVVLSDLEWRLLEPLVARLGHVVRREELTSVAWPGGPVRPNALHVRITRARKRVEPLGLTITTVRGRGYVLTVEE